MPDNGGELGLKEVIAMGVGGMDSGGIYAVPISYAIAGAITYHGDETDLGIPVGIVGIVAVPALVEFASMERQTLAESLEELEHLAPQEVEEFLRESSDDGQ